MESADLEFYDLSNGKLGDFRGDALRGDEAVGRLDLGANHLTKLPDWVATLPNLRWLNVSGNHLTQLPPELGRLNALVHLDAFGNQLDHLPWVVARLRRLEFLGLSRNKIGPIPVDLVLPHSIETLYLGHNHLRQFPSQLRELTRLTSLFLSGNEISSIPPWIAELSLLRELRLTKNRIASIPPALCQLKHLEELVISDNDIASVPICLAAMPALRLIEVEDNPLSAPQALAYASGTRGLLAYLRGLARGSAVRHEAKVLVIGEGETGKTTLLRRLRDATFYSSSSTHGIEVDRLTIHASDHSGPPFTLNTWDFGGQEVYRITHQFFFSRNALYILVWKPRTGVQEGAVEDWLRRIRLRVGEHARVLIVATHGHERQPEIDIPWLKREFPSMIAGSIVVDSRTGLNFDGLIDAIYGLVENLPFAVMPWPASWIEVRDHLSREAAARTHMAWAEFVSLCIERHLEEDECRTLAEILNEFGYIVYWADDPTISDLIVLQPEWLTKAISYILEDPKTRAAGGVLDYTQAQHVWDSHSIEDAFEPAHYPFFLRLMERFDVSYRIVGQPRALVGQLVPHERPASALSQITSYDGGAVITAVCKLSEDPPGLIPWLIVRSNKDWCQPPVHWRRGMALYRQRYQSWALIEQTSATALTVTVRAAAPDFYFHVVLDMFEEVVDRWPGLEWSILMPCPKADELGRACTGEYSLATLMKARELGRRTVTCHVCVEEVDVTSMLSGFQARFVSGSMSDRVDGGYELVRFLERLQQEVSDIKLTSELSLAVAANIADGVRGLFRFVSNEVSDCPRLISIEPLDQSVFDARRFFQLRYRLHLWCEHEDDRHRVGSYDFSRPREWWIEASPYIRAASLILKGVPMARTVIGYATAGLTDEQAKADVTRLESELDLMKQVGDIGLIAPEHRDSHLAQSSTELVRGGSRRVKAMLFDLDPRQDFKGLSRTPVTPTGEFFWVCNSHMPVYDPGLPTLG